MAVVVRRCMISVRYVRTPARGVPTGAVLCLEIVRFGKTPKGEKVF